VPLSCNLGTLTSWNPLGHSRPVMRLPLISTSEYRFRQDEQPPKRHYTCPTGSLILTLSLSLSLSVLFRLLHKLITFTFPPKTKLLILNKSILPTKCIILTPIKLNPYIMVITPYLIVSLYIHAQAQEHPPPHTHTHTHTHIHIHNYTYQSYNFQKTKILHSCGNIFSHHC